MANIPSSTTAAELLSFVADGNRCELVNGEVVMMSPAGGRHGKVAMKLGMLLANHVEEAGSGSSFTSR